MTGIRSDKILESRGGSLRNKRTDRLQENCVLHPVGTHLFVKQGPSQALDIIVNNPETITKLSTSRLSESIGLPRASESKTNVEFEKHAVHDDTSSHKDPKQYFIGPLCTVPNHSKPYAIPTAPPSNFLKKSGRALVNVRYP